MHAAIDPASFLLNDVATSDTNAWPLTVVDDVVQQGDVDTARRHVRHNQRADLQSTRRWEWWSAWHAERCQPEAAWNSNNHFTRKAAARNQSAAHLGGSELGDVDLARRLQALDRDRMKQP